MPIHDQSYRHWEGEFRSHVFRWWVITREGLRILLRHKLFLLFILGPPAVHVFVTGAIIYGTSVIETVPKMPNLKIVNPKFFFDFFMRQIFFITPICVFGGSGLIANDLKSNALQLYLSKPLTRLDYLAGKLAVVIVLMGFLMVVPGILLFIENAVLSEGATFIKEGYWMLGSIILYSLILTFPTGLLILALSSVAKSSRYAAIIFIAILTGTPIFSEMLKGILKLKSAVFISYWSNLDILGKRLFGLSSRYDWYWAMLIILGITGLCVWIMHRKVKGVEIAE
jgi:ABC-2 type transport system permease protein